ncbi:penicillin-insensitive murein endopeptidase [Rhodopila sp.]|uniref:penicillin-insensitive murein endopeptidase n=1 Tax=Rhodopila sp. TaxID=2480087 RepID=UPI003D144C52
MILRIVWFILFSMSSLAWGALQAHGRSNGQADPVPGPLHIIGGPATGGCIAGAISLPANGPGFQTIHINRSAFWGAPETIAALETLAREAGSAGLPPLLIEDISRPRGGPLPGGHVSHQIGLDADIGLDVRPRADLDTDRRDTITLVSLVQPDGRGVDPAVWSPRVMTLLRLTAALPAVDRILVNPAIKQQLCREVTDDRSWLRLIRPWYGHAAHMHIRFRCPAGQVDCVQAAPPPAGDGCDGTLQWWFDQLDAPAKPSAPYHPPPPLAACKAILGDVE